MKSYLRMMLCLLAVAGFIKLFPLVLSEIEAYTEIINNSKELGIDNASLFYSEEPLTSTAEQEMIKRLNAEIE